MWELEYVPEKLVRAAFVILHKKADTNDPSNYRCIGLLPHSYKVLSIIMLDRIVRECSHFLSDWQAGFRQQRGCRDNILLLRVMIDIILKQKKGVCLTFIDYSAAFDSVSHKFLDRGRGLQENQVNVQGHIRRSQWSRACARPQR